MKKVYGDFAWRNNYALSWRDVIGCNSFALWILMTAKTRKKHLFYFTSQVRTTTDIK